MDKAGLESQGSQLRLAAFHGCSADEASHLRSLQPELTIWLDQAMQADQPTIRRPHSSIEPLGLALGLPSDYSAIAAPMRAGEQRLGLLALAHRAAGRYGTESQAMTAAFASYAAVAIENARLYEAAQEQAWISTVLLQVAEATRSLTTLDQVLETVVRLLPMLLGAERCALLLSPDEGEPGHDTGKLFVPVIAIINLLPISFNGLGMREGVYQFLFVPVGVADASAIAMSLAFYFLRLSTGLIGGILYALRSARGITSATS